jgi:hypothetical protein
MATTHMMALTNIPLTKAFMLQYEEGQCKAEQCKAEQFNDTVHCNETEGYKETPRSSKPRIEQHSIAKKIVAPTIMDKTFIDKTSTTSTSTPINILPPVIHIQIKTATGQCIYIKINPTATIIQLKKQIYVAQDVSLESQRIIFGGKQLEDPYTLCHYNITDNSVLHIILRLRGGMFHKSSSRADFISLNYSNKMERGLSMLDYLKRESSREMFVVLEDFEEMLKNTRNDVEIDMVYDLIHKIYID